VDWHHLPRERSWADAGTSTQPDTIPAYARTEGVSAWPNSSKVLGIDNPPVVTRSYQQGPSSVTSGTRRHLGPVLLARIGDLLFAGNDEEARWRGWRIEERRGGLARLYRDPAFDRLVQCPDCRGTGVGTAEFRCAPCSGTGRLILDRPPIAHGG
jgi:hypothetical protein